MRASASYLLYFLFVAVRQVRRGGPSNFRREALEFTLMYEDKELERDIRLCKIDQVRRCAYDNRGIDFYTYWLLLVYCSSIEKYK